MTSRHDRARAGRLSAGVARLARHGHAVAAAAVGRACAALVATWAAAWRPASAFCARWRGDRATCGAGARRDRRAACCRAHRRARPRDRRSRSRHSRVAWALRATALSAGARRSFVRLSVPRSRSARSPCAFACAIARRGVFKGDPTVATIVVVIAALLADLHLLSGRASRCSLRVLDAQGRFAPQLAVQRLLHRRTSGASAASAAARDAASRSTRCCSRRSSACCRRCSGSCSRWSCSAAASRYSGMLQADVDPADRHAAVRDRARAGRAVRPHRPRHRLARALLRHSALALDLRLAGRHARADAHVHAHRVHDPVRRARRRSARRSRRRRRRCAPRARACFAP